MLTAFFCGIGHVRTIMSVFPPKPGHARTIMSDFRPPTPKQFLT